MLTDILVLGIRQAGSSYGLVGMSTEPDPTTGRRWVRPLKNGLPLTRDDLIYEGGQPVQLGDVIQLDLLEPKPEPPFTENVLANWDAGPPIFIRDLTEARRAAFFPAHVDPDPQAVLRGSPSRSVCLVRPDEVEAVFSYDAEIEQFETRLFPRIGKLKKEDGVLVYDPYWKRWCRVQLGDEEYIHYDHAELRELVGEMYLTIGLNARGGVQVLGVHTVPAYQVTVDDSIL